MGEFQRGRVRRIILEFEYPDGSLKTLNVDSPSEVGMIAFDEHWMRDDDLSLFRVSEDDWRQNPSMLMYPGPGSPPEVCRRDPSSPSRRHAAPHGEPAV